MKLRLLVLLTFLLATMGSIAQSGSSSSSQDQSSKMPEIHGFDLAAMDRSAEPCDDFYQFVCGGWVKNNPIPADQPRWGRFSQLAERNREIARQILEKASANDAKRDAVHQ